MSFTIFPYHWNYNDHWEDYRCKTTIRIWGWNEKNEGICVRVHDFKIPIYIDLPDIELTSGKPFNWKSEDRIDKLIKYLKECHQKKWCRPVEITPEDDKIPLYENRFHLKDDKLQIIPKTFLKLEFDSQRAADKFIKDTLTAPVTISLGVDRTFQFHYYCSKKSLSPVMKLMTVRKLPSSNWIIGKGTPIVGKSSKESNKQHEYIVDFDKLEAHPEPEKMPLVHPKVCSFDIEAYSSDGTRMPDPEHPSDVILQIGCVFARKGVIESKVCLSLGEPRKPLINTGENDDFILKVYQSERQLLLGWRDLMMEEDPEVLIGYNIFGFDLMYMSKRAALCEIKSDFEQFSCVKNQPAEVQNMEWESSARGKIMFTYYDVQGRLFIDVLPMVQASEKLTSYKLEYVASVHLKTNKDPIKPKDIFKSWKTKDWELFYRVAAYCVQDCVVTYLLYEKLMFWLGLVESATVNKVPIFCMVVQGQQIKAFAQVFDYCYNNNMICNTPEKKPKSPYRGAFVEEPKAGLYNMILPFDFASLYPSIIIAHNIDFSTFVKHDQLEELPAHMWEAFEGDDHVDCGCPKDPKGKKEVKQRYNKVDGTPIIAKPKKVVCSTYKHVFIKNEYIRGVIPTIITELLAARKKVRKVIEKQEQMIHELEEENEKIGKEHPKYSLNKEEITRLKEVNQVLDKRQSAFKVNANSMYGMFGAENGYLPFFPGAETVTFVGRRSIKAASDRLEQVHHGEVIYNDTDSAYTYFPTLVNKSVQEIWEFASGVVDDIKKLFKEPMKLEFEGKIYPNFLILTKKRYVAQTVDEHGKLKDKLTIRGLPLVRREYCKNMVAMYDKVVRYVFNNIKAITAINKYTDGDYLRRQNEYRSVLNMIQENFIHVMSMGCIYDGTPTKYIDFTIFKGLNKEKYAGKVAHAIVADKIRARGTPVPQNSRIEMLYICSGDLAFDKNKKVAEIAEDLGYFKEFSHILRIDYLQYFKGQYIKNFDVLLEVIFGGSKACTQLFSYLVQKNYLCKQLKGVFRAPITIDESQFDMEQYKLYEAMEKRTDKSKIYVSEPVAEVKVEVVLESPYKEFWEELIVDVKESWQLKPDLKMIKALYGEYANTKCYPVKEHIFRCFTYFDLSECKVVLLGQDPYPNVKQFKDGRVIPHAMGLSFSVPDEINPPPSLVNMFKELYRDLQIQRGDDGNLEDWANAGVLLINSALSLRAHESNSHKKIWLSFTNDIISYISTNTEGVVFILLGNDAKDKARVIANKEKHCIIEAGHPSTLNLKGTYEGCKMYSRTNEYLKSIGKEPIRWY